jgi:hypothetical protein
MFSVVSVGPGTKYLFSQAKLTQPKFLTAKKYLIFFDSILTFEGSHNIDEVGQKRAFFELNRSCRQGLETYSKAQQIVRIFTSCEL